MPRECLQIWFVRFWAESQSIPALPARGRAKSPAPSRSPWARPAAAPKSAKPGLKTLPRSACAALVVCLSLPAAFAAQIQSPSGVVVKADPGSGQYEVDGPGSGWRFAGGIGRAAQSLKDGAG